MDKAKLDQIVRLNEEAIKYLKIRMGNLERKVDKLEKERGGP